MTEMLSYFIQPSLSTFFTIFIFSSLLICMIYIIFKDNSYFHNMGVYVFPCCLFILGVRLFIPLEIRYSKSYYFKGIYYNFMRFLRDDRFNLGNMGISIADILLGFIVLGIIVNIFRAIRRYSEFYNLIIVTSKFCQRKDREILDKVLQKYKNKEDFELIRSDIISTPVIFGLKRPCIVLPEQDYNDEQLEYILAHETAHYYRKDLWTKLMLQMVCIVYWWNPFIYLLKDDVTKFLELRTDLAVTKDYEKQDKLDYAECILKVFKDISVSGMVITDNVVAFGNDSKTVVKQRVNMVLDTYKPSIFKRVVVVMPMIMILCASYLVVLEPNATLVSTRDEYVIDRSCAYAVDSGDGSFDIYVFDEYEMTVDDLKYNLNQCEDSFGRITNTMLELKQYKSYEEAIKDEKRFS